jgi:hypothetical protein
MLEGEEAQLVLSYIVWPDEAPLPNAVDEWLVQNDLYDSQHGFNRRSRVDAVHAVRRAGVDSGGR